MTQRRPPVRRRARSPRVTLGLWAIALLALATTCVTGQAGGAGREAEAYLDEFMARHLKESAHEQTFSDRADKLARALDEASARDPRLLASIEQVLHLGELEAETDRAPPPGELARRKRNVGLGLLLEEGEGPAGPHLVRRALRADPQKIKEQARNDFVRLLPRQDQREWLEAAQELVRHHDGQLDGPVGQAVAKPGRARQLGRALARIVETIANFGITFMDHFFASPEIFEQLPVIGHKVKRLKREGEPIYLLAKTVRHSFDYFKLAYGESAGGASDWKRMGRAREPTRASDEEEEEEAEQLVDEAQRQAKLRELKQLMGKEGKAALKSIVRRMFERRAEEAKERSGQSGELKSKEMQIRTLYTLVSYLLD